MQRKTLCILRRTRRRVRSVTARRRARLRLAVRLVLDALRAAELLEVVQALDVVLAEGGAFARLVRLACLQIVCAEG